MARPGTTQTVYRRLYARYIRLQPALQARVDAFAVARMAGRRWVAVHVRGSDKITELRDLELVNAAVPAPHRRRCCRPTPAMGIFLLTDSEHFARDYRQRYGDRVLVRRRRALARTPRACTTRATTAASWARKS